MPPHGQACEDDRLAMGSRTLLVVVSLQTIDRLLVRWPELYWCARKLKRCANRDGYLRIVRVIRQV